MTRGKMWITAPLFLCVVVGVVLSYQYMMSRPIDVPLIRNIKEQGVIVLAHGSNPHWNYAVREAVQPLAKKYPTRIAFGMADVQTIQKGIDDLEALNVERIVVVPLYISSYSELFRQTEYVLGFRSEPDPDFIEGMERAMRNPFQFLWKKITWDNIPFAIEMMLSHRHAHTDAKAVIRTPVVLLSALDSSPLVGDIIEERTLELSKNPSEETIILVAHGPIRDDDDVRWLETMRTLSEPLHAYGFHSLCIATIRDDAGKEVKDRAIKHLRMTIDKCTKKGRRAIIVPLLLSRGGIEKEIHHILKGLPYVYDEKTLLPHENISEWLLRSADFARTVPAFLPSPSENFSNTNQPSHLPRH